jgi:hypothetical protein
LIKVIFLGIYLGILFPLADLSAQNQIVGLSIAPQVGFLLPHRSTMAHLNTGHSYGGKLSTVFQTNGTKQWHHDFLFPRIESDIFFYDLGNPEILGNAFGVQSGLYLPFFRGKSWSFGSLLGFGIAYITKTYDSEENPKNNVIGSHFNTIANLGIRVEKQFHHNSIGVEISMTHLSNGAYKLPNLGINLPFLGFNYTHFLEPLHFQKEASSKYTGLPLKTWAFYTQLIGSFKQVYPTGGNTYGVVGLTNYAQYRVKTKLIIEGGIDAIYNQSIIKNSQEDLDRINNFQIGLYAAYVLPMSKMQLMVGMGRYVINPISPSGMWYHRFGARLRFTDLLWGHFMIKSNWAKADYFEYGLTYRWK